MRMSQRLARARGKAADTAASPPTRTRSSNSDVTKSILGRCGTGAPNSAHLITQLSFETATRSSFLKFESYSSCVVDLIGPRVNDGVLVEVIHGGHEPILEFLLGGNANVAQHRARKFGKEALDEVEPGAVLRREDKFKAVFAPTGKPSSGLFGDVRGMIVEDQLDRGSGRIGGVEQLEEFDEFAAAVAILDQSVDLAGDEINPSQQTDRAVPLVFMLAGKGRVHAGLRRQIGGGRS